MMPRSPRPPRAKLHRPSAPSSQSRTSPPSSPNLAASTSVDDHLDGSFLLVSGGVNNTEAVCGEDDEISSNVGSSLRDSLIGDLLSDTSEEPAGREAWEGSTDGGDVDHPPNPWLGGSFFIDAEATATEDSSSANQLHESTFSSQVKLIMPALEASGLTSDGSTPNESLANLLNIPHVQRSSTPACSTQRRRATSPSGRGVEPSWLEASSRLWNVSPELGNILGEGGEYWLLASTDRKPKQMTEEPKEAMSESHLQASLTQAEKPRGYVEAVDQQLRRALFSADMVGLSGKTKRW